MNPVSLAGPAVEPVSLAETKLFLRLDGTDEDDLVAALIAAARLLVERTTRLALVQQSWRWRVERPSARAVALPLAPVVAVSAVRLIPAAGSPVVLDPASYRLEAARDPPCVILDGPGAPAGAIEIDAAYGFGATADAVPPPLRLAIRMLVARFFANRGDRVETGETAGIPGEVRALLAPYARPRLA